MCLIIYNPTPEPIPEEYIRNAHSTNNDGFGIMWVEDGRVRTIQGMFGIDTILELFKRLEGKPFAAHFRMATCGTVDASITHPFKVLTKEEDGEDLYIMHNGIFSFYPDHKDGRSDTAQFAENMAEIFRNIGETDPLWDNEELTLFEAQIGSGNKVLFMRSDGKVAIANADAGFIENGIWYSNKYSIIKYSYSSYGGFYGCNGNYVYGSNSTSSLMDKDEEESYNKWWENASKWDLEVDEDGV